VTSVAGRSRSIQSVDRAAALLKEIADSPQPPTVAELATRCGLNRSTTWRLLGTLVNHGLVERDPISQRYGVGYAFLRIAAASELDPIVRRARPVLERLAARTGEAVNLAIAKGASLVYVDQVDPPQVIAANWLGRTVPLHATSSGKAFLAYLGAAERAGLLSGRLERFTAATITDKRMLYRELDAVRPDGYAICVGELEESLFGVSAAVLTEQGRPLAIVSVWGPEHRVPRERLPAVGELTRAAADEIKDRLR
jgi:DNA-binding IclR family transcriptional regulator